MFGWVLARFRGRKRRLLTKIVVIGGLGLLWSPSVWHVHKNSRIDFVQPLMVITKQVVVLESFRIYKTALQKNTYSMLRNSASGP